MTMGSFEGDVRGDSSVGDVDDMCGGAGLDDIAGLRDTSDSRDAAGVLCSPKGGCLHHYHACHLCPAGHLCHACHLYNAHLHVHLAFSSHGRASSPLPPSVCSFNVVHRLSCYSAAPADGIRIF